MEAMTINLDDHTTDYDMRPVGKVRRGRYPARSRFDALVAATHDPHALMEGETLRLPHTGTVVTIASPPTIEETAPGTWTGVADVRAATPFEHCVLQQIEVIEASLRARAADR
jgi:hypothetical protein